MKLINKPVALLVVAGLATLAFQAKPAIAQNAAVVNGTSIPSARVDAFVAAMVAQGRDDTPDLRQAVREELIARELFVQEAQSRKLEDDEQVQNRLIRARQDILISALIRSELVRNPITDEQIKAEYDRMTAAQSGEKEYRASHILVQTEDEAKKIIAALDKGEDFAKLAEKSQDPGSASRGGDLDWNTPATFADEFSKAMVALDKGKYTKQPVKTQFGYHVILLADTREAQPPAIESMKPKIRQQLERNRVGELQERLRKEADIR